MTLLTCTCWFLLSTFETQLSRFPGWIFTNISARFPNSIENLKNFLCIVIPWLFQSRQSAKQEFDTFECSFSSILCLPSARQRSHNERSTFSALFHRPSVMVFPPKLTPCADPQNSQLSYFNNYYYWDFTLKYFWTPNSHLL